MALIDVWNLDTFDAALIDALRSQRQLIVHYYSTDRANCLEREASDHRGPLPSNPYAAAYYRFSEELMVAMHTRTIRAWHHTRMTDQEVVRARRGGLYPATLETLRIRLENMVADGNLLGDEAQSIFDASPFHDDSLDSRADKFWMTSHLRRIDDSGVTSLLANWGGESAYFKHGKGEILDKLSKIGTPRVLEVAVPLAMTPDAYSAATAVIALYARSLGCHTDRGGFDLYAFSVLGPQSILRVHSSGEDDFEFLARGYPTEFHDRFGGP